MVKKYYTIFMIGFGLCSILLINYCIPEYHFLIEKNSSLVCKFPGKRIMINQWRLDFYKDQYEKDILNLSFFHFNDVTFQEDQYNILGSKIFKIKESIHIPCIIFKNKIFHSFAVLYIFYEGQIPINCLLMNESMGLLDQTPLTVFIDLKLSKKCLMNGKTNSNEQNTHGKMNVIYD